MIAYVSRWILKWRNRSTRVQNLRVESTRGDGACKLQKMKRVITNHDTSA